MNTNKHVFVRAKFVGGLLIFLLLILSLALLSRPTNIFYIIGIVAPSLYLLYLCFNTRQREFNGLVILSKARFVYVCCLAIGLTLHINISVGFAYGWYISAFVYSLYEPIVFNVFVLLGFISPAPNKTGFK